MLNFGKIQSFLGFDFSKYNSLVNEKFMYCFQRLYVLYFIESKYDSFGIIIYCWNRCNYLQR